MGGLTRAEEFVLVAVFELRDEAYGVSIRRHLAERAGRRLSLGGVYGSLERLSREGYLEPRLGAATPVRGGRRKRLFRLTPKGRSALQAARRREERLWGRVAAVRNLRSGAR